MMGTGEANSHRPVSGLHGGSVLKADQCIAWLLVAIEHSRQSHPGRRNAPILPQRLAVGVKGAWEVTGRFEPLAVIEAIARGFHTAPAVNAAVCEPICARALGKRRNSDRHQRWIRRRIPQ